MAGLGDGLLRALSVGVGAEHVRMVHQGGYEVVTRPRILVLSASVGAGHVRAAEAVEAALHEIAPDVEVRNLDVLTMTNRAFRSFYSDMYVSLISRAPHVLGCCYDYLDKPNRSDRWRLMFERLNMRRFARFIRQERWDLAICTHFLPSQIIAWLRRKGKSRIKQVTAVTDFGVHRLWVNQPCDHYCTATEEGAVQLRCWGVPRADVTVTGVPIHPAFSHPKNRSECLRKHGLCGDLPIVLQLAGGFIFAGPVVEIHQALLAVEQPLEIAVVTGHNDKAKAELERSNIGCLRHRVKVIGFTKDMDELMAVADLVVSKPGGLTASETLASGAVMAIVNPIPGQETRNSDWLLESGAAIKVNSIGTLPYNIDRLLADKSRLAGLKANAVRIAKPQAAHDVANRSLRLLEVGK